MIIQLPYRFKPRNYQLDFLKAFYLEKYRHFFWLVHRRAGKDKTCINLITSASQQRVGTYLYLLPEHKQARRVIWRGIDGQGMRFLDHIPKELVAKANNTEMLVEMKNGSIIQFGGANNFNSLMGTNPIGIVHSEYPLHNPLARQYLSPILAENGGWEVLQGTPRGKNHAHKLYLNSVASNDWYTKKLTVDDTFKEDGKHVITPEMIEQERRNGMSDEMIEQEYYCSFDIGNFGAYFTKELNEAEKDGRIGLFEVKKNIPVWTFWDIGMSDATAIWFMQPVNGQLHFFYYYEMNNVGMEHYIQIREEVKQKFGIRYEADYAPHDIRVREWTSARSRIMTAQDAGLHFRITPNHAIDDRIQAIRTLFPQVRIHSEHCYQGINCLREYCRDWDEVNKIFKDKPKHNWAGHGSDAFGYAAIVWRDLFTHPHLSEPRKYQMDF